MTKKGILLTKIGKTGDSMKGSLALTYRKCGKGKFHKGYFFSYRFKGKSYGLYVPENLVSKVKKTYR